MTHHPIYTRTSTLRVYEKEARSVAERQTLKCHVPIEIRAKHRNCGASAHDIAAMIFAANAAG